MIGPIRGTRLPAETKLAIVRAVHGATRQGVRVHRACDVLMLDPRRLRRWMAGRPPGAVTEDALTDVPPVAHRHPHALLPAERAEILAAAREDDLADLRHRKLTHELSRRDRAYCCPSTTLRVLRSEHLVPSYQRRSRPVRPRPETDESEPNRTWRYDLTSFPTLEGPYHLVPVIDGCSRKIVGHAYSPEATSTTVQDAWGKALASEGLFAASGPELPAASSDRGTQMTSRSTRAFFAELGIAQSFSRARTPTDNATAESWMATLKCERLYDADTASMTPAEVHSMIERFIGYYNDVRLHQGLGYVTPAERHDGRHTTILEARRRGMGQARAARMAANRQAPHSKASANGAHRASERPVSRRPNRKGVTGPCS